MTSTTTSGAARLDDDARDAVLRLAGGSAEPALVAVAPAGALDVVRSPVARWRLVVAGATSRLEHRAWVGASDRDAAARRTPR